MAEHQETIVRFEIEPTLKLKSWISKGRGEQVRPFFEIKFWQLIIGLSNEQRERL